MTAPALLTYGYTQIVNALGLQFFGLRPVSSNVITDIGATDPRSQDILRAINDGLLYVYNAHRWSFFRPAVSINTYGPYSTGTITVASDGTIVLNGGSTPSDGGFPSYTATASGQVWIGTPTPPNFYQGIWYVGTYTDATHIKLSNYTGPAYATAIPYSLIFNSYPLPTGFDTFEEDLTEFAQGYFHRHSLQKVDELEIRQHMMMFNGQTHKPHSYAISMAQFNPQTSPSASPRYVSFWPVPNGVHTYWGKGILRPTMIDVTNQYIPGIEIMAPAIMEACLAAGERNIDQIDGSSPEAVHARAMIPLLQMAIQRDKENASPDSVGVDYGSSEHRHNHKPYRQSSIYWNNGGYVGWL